MIRDSFPLKRGHKLIEDLTLVSYDRITSRTGRHTHTQPKSRLAKVRPCWSRSISKQPSRRFEGLKCLAAKHTVLCCIVIVQLLENPFWDLCLVPGPSRGVQWRSLSSVGASIGGLLVRFDWGVPVTFSFLAPKAASSSSLTFLHPTSSPRLGDSAFGRASRYKRCGLSILWKFHSRSQGDPSKLC